MVYSSHNKTYGLTVVSFINFQEQTMKMLSVDKVPSFPVNIEIDINLLINRICHVSLRELLFQVSHRKWIIYT